MVAIVGSEREMQAIKVDNDKDRQKTREINSQRRLRNRLMKRTIGQYVSVANRGHIHHAKKKKVASHC